MSEIRLILKDYAMVGVWISILIIFIFGLVTQNLLLSNLTFALLPISLFVWLSSDQIKRYFKDLKSGGKS